MTNRELIQKAIDDLDVYKHPNMEDALDLMDAILEASGEGRIGSDEIVHLSMGKEYVQISTRWYARSCECTGDYSFKTAFLDADDPIKAAKLDKLHGDVNKAQQELESAQQRVERVLEWKRQVEDALAEFTKDDKQ